MIKIQRKQSRYWMNRVNIFNVIRIVFFSILFLSCNRTSNKVIIGFYNIDKESSNWFRQNDDIYLMNTCIIIYEDSIFLPVVARMSDSTYQSKYDMSDERYWTDLENQKTITEHAKKTMKDFNNARGTYKLIGDDLDTIVIYASEHPLNGKYAFHMYPDSIYKTASMICHLVVFENDSTLLRCYKNKQ